MGVVIRRRILLAKHAQWGAGGWNNRFKNAWEPVFHFARTPSIKFNPDAVSAPSDDMFEYSPDNPKSESGSGLLGSGKRKNQRAGLARPSNVIEVAAESGQGDHSAPFPRALVEFFVKAFSDAGDVIFDPFLGSGTTIAAAHVLGRNGYGCEISPSYCDLVVLRWQQLSSGSARLDGDGRTFEEIARERKESKK
jgi:site-specific DNA-methyltransferase (adenine-specific)/site-specific DNA-methyltransferase (cytosine-N4-specific)